MAALSLMPQLIIEADRTRPSGSPFYKRSMLFVPSCAGQAMLSLNWEVVCGFFYHAVCVCGVSGHEV